MKGFAYLLGGDGKVERLSIGDALDRTGSTALLWLHLDANDPDVIDWLEHRSGINPVVAAALVATETRPRTEQIDEGALINLRGLAEKPLSMSDSLASIRLWADTGRVISSSRHPLSALPAVETDMARGTIADPGDLIAGIATAITGQLDPDVAALGDQLDDCEERMDGKRLFALRRTISQVRAQAIGYRRFVAPQRDALERLSRLKADWLQDDDRLHLKEAADRAARMAEELEAVRERAALIHEQIVDLRSEQIQTPALLISVVALVFLPLTFITGLLGMNVKGIPYADKDWAFSGVVWVCVAIAVGITGYFIRAHWFRR